MKTVQLKTGETIPALGLGMTVIDTAEMYAEGGAEEVVGQAIAGRRDKVYLVSKVYPHNASRAGVAAACERSLKRLGTNRLDLYLLHWRGSHPLAETVSGFEALKAQGKIRAWGVSNFDTGDMAELARVTNGRNCVCNQVLYHPGARGIEWQLLPDCQKANVMVMAYSPLGQGEILGNAALAATAKKHATMPAAIALAFLLRHQGVTVIPKAATEAHVRANAAARDITFDAADLAVLDRAFPPPKRAAPLAML